MSLKPDRIPGGLLVVFEGVDGAGKSTQLELACSTLQAEGWPVYTTRNLGGTPIGEELRKIIKSPLERPNTTNLYISVAIQEALADAIESERRQGRLILMDRGPMSLAAYEIYGGQLDPQLGWQHVDNGMKRLRPDLNIIYATDVDTALARAKAKSDETDYFESQPRDFFERVANGYEAAAERYAAGTIVIDANRPVEAIQSETIAAIRQALEAKLQAAA